MSQCFGLVTITFDDIVNATSSQGPIPNSYNCLNWINGWYIDAAGLSILSGYRLALVSGSYVGSNTNGSMMNISRTNSSFNVYSFVATSASQILLELSIQGIRGNTIVIGYTQTILLYSALAQTITLNWYNLTTITFQSYFSQIFPPENLVGPAYQFAFDNLIVNLN
jgi:hypothetical protein